LTTAAANGEWLTVKLRYKAPNEDESRLVAATLSGQPGRIRAASENARFSTAVALFGMLLRDSEFIGAGSYGLVEKLAGGALGQDEHGERREFLKLVERAQRL
jgi:Ca-activated chloride channel family protein